VFTPCFFYTHFSMVLLSHSHSRLFSLSEVRNGRRVFRLFLVGYAFCPHDIPWLSHNSNISWTEYIINHLNRETSKASLYLHRQFFWNIILYSPATYLAFANAFLSLEHKLEMFFISSYSVPKPVVIYCRRVWSATSWFQDEVILGLVVDCGNHYQKWHNFGSHAECRHWWQ